MEKNNEMNLDAGLYVNLFEVEFEDCTVELMCASRDAFPKVRDLRDELAEEGVNVQVYAVTEEIDEGRIGKIYGYGSEQHRLESRGFQTTTVRIREVPQLTSRMILDGFVDSLRKLAYTCRWSFGRADAYQFDTPLVTTRSGVRLFRGFELQSMYLVDPETEALAYGMIINSVFTYRDKDDKALHMHEVVSRFGSDTLKQLRIKQGDLAPFGGINLEVSRQRLVEITLPFVSACGHFELPCGIPARLNEQPVRVILASQEQQT